MRNIRQSVITLFSLLAVIFPAALSGQTSVSRSVSVEETVQFRPHLFLQPQAGIGLTVGERKMSELISPAAAINLGYRFTPAFALRAGVSGWQARGAWVSPVRHYKFGYLQGSVDAMLSFTNLVCGYNPDRTLDFYGFLGAGVAGGFHNNDAERLNAEGYHFDRLWTGKTFFPAARAGLGLDVNLSRSLALSLEVNADMLPDKFNSKKGSSVDWQCNALIGVKYSFGGRSRKIVSRTEEVVEEVAAPAPHTASVSELTPLPEPAKVEPVRPEPMKQDIFFRINSSVISQAEQPKVDALILYLKENPDARIVITGYADRATGYPAYNLKLSAARADRVAAALKAAGIDQSRITVQAKGDTVQPFDAVPRNRVAICLAQ